MSRRYDVVVLPDAEAEIESAFLWYRERSQLAADAFRTEVFDAMDGLATRAHMWPEDDEGVRHYVLDHFPYTIHYECDGHTVIVLAVAHQRRRPGYWRER